MYAVIDFETTGMSPNHGARPTEIGVVLIEDGAIVDRYQSLMNPGVHIPYPIQQLTGITDVMVSGARPVATVMQEAIAFVGNRPLVAHNAAFDRKFWDAELERIGRARQHDMVCSMRLSRRVFPGLASYSLASLVASLHLPVTGRHHRALADADASASLLLLMQKELRRRFCLPKVDHVLLLMIQAASRNALERCIADYRRVCR